jgi:hypothetical protein
VELFGTTIGVTLAACSTALCGASFDFVEHAMDATTLDVTRLAGINALKVLIDRIKLDCIELPSYVGAT